MVKYLLSFLFVFLMLSTFSFAKDDDSKLQEEFGRDLSHAPFFLRFAYYREFNKDWKKTDYLERKVFLTEYETNLAVEQAQEKADAKAEADKEKQDLLDKKEAAHKEAEKLKARLAEDKAEKLADDERQKEFDKSLKEQARELDQMRQRGISQGSSQQGVPDQGTSQDSSAQGSY